MMTAKQCHFVFGTDPFLVDDKVQSLKETLPHNTIERFSEKVGIPDLEQCLQHDMLFSQTKLILIKNPRFLTDALPDKQSSALQALLNNTSQTAHHVVIYWTGKSLDQRKKMVQWLKKHAASYDFPAFKDWEQAKLAQWIQQRFQTRGKSIDMPTSQSLQNQHSTLCGPIAQDIDAICLYVGESDRITASDIDAMSGGASSQLFSLTEAIKDRHVARAMTALYHLLRQGDDPVKLLSIITASYRLYLQILALDSERVPESKLASKIGKNPYFIKKLLPSIRRHYSLPRLTAVYQALSDCDIAIKSGQQTPKHALTTTLYTCLTV